MGLIRLQFPTLNPRSKIGLWAMIAATAALVLLFGIYQDHCNDVWGHALHGKVMLEQGRFPRFSDYSFVEGQDVAWNADCIPSLFFYSLLQVFGYPGLLLYKAAGIGLAVTFLILWTREEGAPWPLGFCAAFYFMIMAENRFLPRSDLMNMAFLAIYLFCLSRHRNIPAWRPVWALPLLQVLWVHFHYLACLGWFVVLAYASEGVWSGLRARRAEQKPVFSAYHKKMLALALACFLASFVNEATWRKVLIPFSVLFQSRPEDRILYSTVFEFQSLLDSSWACLWPGFFLPAVLLGTLFIVRRQVRSSHLILSVSFFLAAAIFVRLIGLYTLVVSGLVAIYCWQWLERRTVFPRCRGALKFAAFSAVSANLVMAILMLRPYWAEDSSYLRKCAFHLSPVLKPVRAVEFLKAQRLHGNIYVSYNEGGFVGYHVYPDSKIFIHSLSLWYSREHYSNWMQLNNPLVVAELYDVDIFLLHHCHPPEFFVLLILHESPEWKMVYLDETTAIYARTGHSLPALDLDRYSVEARNVCCNYGFYWLGNLLLELRHFARAEEFYQKARELGVEIPNVLNDLGKIAAAQGDMCRAVEYFAASVRLAPSRTSLENLERAVARIPKYRQDTAAHREALELLERHRQTDR